MRFNIGTQLTKSGQECCTTYVLECTYYNIYYKSGNSLRSPHAQRQGRPGVGGATGVLMGGLNKCPWHQLDELTSEYLPIPDPCRQDGHDTCVCLQV